MSKAVLLISCLLLYLSTPLQAADEALQTRVEISLNDDQTHWLGQQLTVNLDLKTTGLSFSDIHFSLPEVNGAFFIQTDSSTVKFNETVAGKTWQILRYPLALYPQKSGLIRIPEISVRLASTQGFGFEKQQFDKITQILELTVQVPPGLKPGESVISTADFKLDYLWDPQIDEANIGAAFSLSVSRRADNITAMLFPPLPVYQVDGLAVYPQTPEINDRSNRGTLSGQRRDKIIWVAEAPGQYTIPDIQFQWFDPVSGHLKQQTIPGKQLNISNTRKAFSNSSADSGHRAFKYFSFLISLIMLSLLLWWLRPGQRYKARQTPPEFTEPGSFKLLQKACRQNQAETTYRAFHHWLNFYADSMSQTALLQESELLNSLKQLQEAIINPAKTWQGKALLKTLDLFRNRLRQEKTVQLSPDLPPLNP